MRSMDGPCTAVADFISDGINAVASALKVDTSGGGFLGFLARSGTWLSIWPPVS
ncbi:hypothetical protein [Catelliglobosispora koreensis]|uniref:hypothetical protein n=1 Tax=Catelliglobosispora koreensis TaxID=129052 RepID=UPI0012FB053E|nr:hypothetical protein [Catelliglobosispora koreensis]